MHQGVPRQLSLVTRERLAHAEHCGDLYGITNLRTLYMPFVLLMDGDIEVAKSELTEGLAQWAEKAKGFHLQHAFALFVQIQLDIYQGDGQGAYDRCRGSARKLFWSLLLQVQLMRGNWYRLCALASLASSTDGGKRKKMLRFAKRYARKLEREGPRWLYYLGRLVRASVEESRGHRERAIELLREAIGGFDDTAQQLNATVARRRLGELVGGSEGNELITAADDWFAREGLRDPETLTAMMAPGFSPPPTK
jgi:hypothetical protein